MISVRYANAMSETLHYLKGIKQEDVDKIPKKFIAFLKENASKEYICNFDYNKPLKELNLLDETKGIIGTICLNYWCITQEQKQEYLNRLNENERKYQEILREKYNSNNIFNNKKEKITPIQNESIAIETTMVEYKESIFKIIINKVKEFFGIKSNAKP